MERILLIHEPLACAAEWRRRKKITAPQNVVVLSLGAGFTEDLAATVSAEGITVQKVLMAPDWGGDQCDFLIADEILDMMSRRGIVNLERLDFSEQERRPLDDLF